MSTWAPVTRKGKARPARGGGGGLGLADLRAGVGVLEWGVLELVVVVVVGLGLVGGHLALALSCTQVLPKPTSMTAQTR